MHDWRVLRSLMLPLMVTLCSLAGERAGAQPRAVEPTPTTNSGASNAFSGAGAALSPSNGGAFHPTVPTLGTSPGPLSVGSAETISHGAAIGGDSSGLRLEGGVEPQTLSPRETEALPADVPLVRGLGRATTKGNGTPPHRGSVPNAGRATSGDFRSRSAAPPADETDFRDAVRDVRVQVQAVGDTVGAARRSESAGRAGAVESSLNALFEDDRRKAAAELAAMPERERGELLQRVRQDPERAVSERLEFAARMSPADAPAFYRLASYLAHENLAPAAAEHWAQEILGRSTRKAAEAVQGLVRQTIAEGVGRGASAHWQERQERLFDAIDFFNDRLRLSGGAALDNVEGVHAEVRRVATLARERPAQAKSQPQVEFVPERRGGRNVLRAVVSATRTLTDVARVPEAASALRLADAEGAFDVGERAPFATVIDLEPEGRARFRTKWLERRGAGASWLEAGALATVHWGAGEARTLWEELRRLWRTLLAALGFDARGDADKPLTAISPDDDAKLRERLAQGRADISVPLADGGEARIVRIDARGNAGAALLATFEKAIAASAKSMRDGLLRRLPAGATPQPALP